MTSQVSNQGLAQQVAQGGFSGFRHRISNQPFSAPFSERKALLIAGDAVLVVLAVFAAFFVWRTTHSVEPDVVTQAGPQWYWFAVLLCGWWTEAWLMDLYHIPSSSDRMASAMRTGLVGVANVVVCLALFLVIPVDVPRLFFPSILLVMWPAITIWRWLCAVLFSTSPLEYRLLIVGHGARAQSIMNVLNISPWLNFRVLGFYGGDESGEPRAASERDGVLTWSQATALCDLARRLQVHRVVVAIDRAVDTDLFYQLVECQANGIGVSLMPDLYEQLCRKVPIEHIDPAWVLHVLQGRRVFTRIQLGLKRAMDLVLGLAGFAVLALSLPLVALAIRLDSAGPIFYRQVRAGRAGKPFRVLKFRTMDPTAESDGRARWATDDDPRITRVGRYLRKSRLDELPQVLNVLRGEMSFVGPRPERPEFVEQLEKDVPFYRIRLMVKPGITGWAQTLYGYGNSTDDALVKLQYDFYYLRNWSLWLDLYIIVRTVRVVFRFEGK